MFKYLWTSDAFGWCLNIFGPVSKKCNWALVDFSWNSSTITDTIFFQNTFMNEISLAAFHKLILDYKNSDFWESLMHDFAMSPNDVGHTLYHSWIRCTFEFIGEFSKCQI